MKLSIGYFGKFAYFTKWAELQKDQKVITEEWDITSITKDARDPNQTWSQSKSILVPSMKFT